MKTATDNIDIYHPHVFRVRAGPSQSYSPECDWEIFSPYSTVCERKNSFSQSNLIKSRNKT